jgi:hypothetical protein
MAHKQSGIHRSVFPFPHGTGAQKRKNIEPDQSDKTSTTQSPINKLEDLGRPPMGWMPRGRVMGLIQQIDAELIRAKGV